MKIPMVLIAMLLSMGVGVLTEHLLETYSVMSEWRRGLSVGSISMITYYSFLYFTENKK